MTIRNFILSFFLVLASFSFGQNMKIKGKVFDTTGTNPLPNALAMAVRVKDSLLLGFARTNSKGEFELHNVPIDTFQLIIDHPQFDEKMYFIFGSESNNDIDIPVIKMPEKAQKIDEVTIYAYKDPIHYRGDTLVYVADSFATHENAVVEDLLKKLPGIEVDKNGKLKSQGEDIAKVLVDGDEFFGEDPTIATKNLGADGVKSVQVYEKEDEDGTFGTDDKIKVLDLKLKEDAKKGYFGRVSGASDFALTQPGNPFFEGELLFNHFRGSQKISVFGLAANTPTSNFAWGDVNRFGLNNESSGNRWDGGGTSNTSGIPQTMKAGIYFSDKFGKKKNGKVTFNYSYYNTKLDAYSASRSEYFLEDTTYFTDDSTRNFTRNQKHRILVDFETNLDSLTKISIEPEITFDFAKNKKNEFSRFLTSEEELSMQTDVLNASESEGLNFRTEFGLERKFMKPKRELNFNYYINKVDNKTNGALQSRTYSTTNPFINDTIDQSKDNFNNLLNNVGYVEYIEPLSKHWRIGAGYSLTVNQLKQDKATNDLDSISGEYTDFREDFSNRFKTDRLEHKGGLNILFDKGKHSANLRLDLRNVDIQNLNQITDSTISQNITNFLPSFNYQFRPSMSKRVRVRYRTYSSQPSVNQLQPVRDNTNPNRIQVGNPDLKPNYVHRLSVNFNNWNALTGRYIWTGVFATLTDNAFANSTYYDPFGRTISQTVNVDGNFSSTLYAGTGVNFFDNVLSLRPRVNGNFNRYSNYINDEKNVTDNLVAGGGLEVMLQWDSLEITVGSNLNYVNPKSSLNEFSSTPYSTQRYNFMFLWRLPLGFSIGTDGDYTINSQRADGYNLNFFIWNAEISKSFLKTENLVLSVIGKDMLNQNINAQRNVNGNVVTDNRTKIISRYFLLKLTLRFNNRGTSEKKDYDMY